MISQYIREYLNKNNLHHAYLIEGRRDEIVPEILSFCENIDIKILGNPDFCRISIDNFKIDDAFDLRAMSSGKGFTSGKKIFLICANSISLDAQNVLLKMFEEPIYNTHFFLVVPDKNSLLKTLVSRFYLISTNHDMAEEIKHAEKFIKMPLNNRIDFIKELLAEPDEEDALPVAGLRPREKGNEIVALDSSRSKAIKFLNALETLLHSKLQKNFSGLLHPADGTFPIQNSFAVCFEHFFKVREFLRQPGSSTKNLMESVAMVIPNL